MEQNFKIVCRSLMCVNSALPNKAITIKIGREMKKKHFFFFWHKFA